MSKINNKDIRTRRSGVFIANSNKLVIVNFINFTSDLFLVFL